MSKNAPPKSRWRPVVHTQKKGRRRGLIQLELSYKTSTIGLFQYLSNTHDWMQQLVNLHESTKKLHSVKKESDNFSRELELEIDKNNHLKPTDIARKSKKLAKSVGVEQLESGWQKKPLHGQFVTI